MSASKTTKKETPMQKNIAKLKDDLRKYRNLSEYLKKTKGLFEGPSIHFHKRALYECSRDFLGKDHLEMIYAVLVSWGMHRMGEKGKNGKNLTKMCEYGEFVRQITTQIIDDPDNKGKTIKIADALKRYEGMHIVDVKEENIETIVELMFNIKVNALESSSRLVSASKVLHHILPHLVPPMDRRYSLKFMHRSIDAQSDNTKTKKLSREKNVAVEFIKEMRDFLNSEYGDRMKKECVDDFDTSLPKIFDNLIVAFVKDHHQK